MRKPSDVFEAQKKSIYSEEDFLFFLTTIKSLWYISEEKYQQLLLKSRTAEFTNMLEVLIKYEIATWLEWPFVFILATYFAGGDILESSKSISSFLQSWEFKSIFQLFQELDVWISKENILYYFASIVPIVMWIRYATLKIITQNKDIPWKDLFCLLGAHPFPTTLTWIWAFTYFLSGYKDFYKIYKIFWKVRSDISAAMEVQKSQKPEEFEKVLWELKVRLWEIIS